MGHWSRMDRLFLSTSKQSSFGLGDSKDNTPSFWRGGWEFKGRLLAGAPEGRGSKMVAAALKINQDKSKKSLKTSPSDLSPSNNAQKSSPGVASDQTSRKHPSSSQEQTPVLSDLVPKASEISEDHILKTSSNSSPKLAPVPSLYGPSMSSPKSNSELPPGPSADKSKSSPKANLVGSRLLSSIAKMSKIRLSPLDPAPTALTSSQDELNTASPNSFPQRDIHLSPLRLERLQPVTPKKRFLAQYELEVTPEKRPRLGDNGPVMANAQPLVVPEHSPVFFEGSVNDVFFVGRGEEWSKKFLRYVFFHTPSGSTLTLRVDDRTAPVPMMRVLAECIKMWNNKQPPVRFTKPIISYKGSLVPPEKNLSHFWEKGATFIVTDGDLSDEAKSHSGKLWHCTNCNRGFGLMKNFNDHAKSKHCKILFKDNFSAAFGRSDLDKKGCSLYALPSDHVDVDMPIPQSIRRIPSSKPSSLLVTSVRPGPSKTSIISPPFTESSSSDKGFSGDIMNNKENDHFKGPVRKSRRVEAKVAKGEAPVYGEEEISGTEDISSEDSEDDYDPTKDKNYDSDTNQSEKTIKKEKRQRGKLRVDLHLLPLTEDEGSDDETPRKLNKKNERELMHNQVRQPFLDNSKWNPDEDDIKYTKKYVTREALMNSGKWKSFHSNFPLEIQEMVEAGELPTNDEDYKYVAKTGKLYQDAFKRLMGLVQKELREKNPENLDNNNLHIRQFFAINQSTFLRLPDIGDLLCQFSSSSVKQHALESYCYLVKGVMKWASTSEEATRLFALPQSEEENLWSKIKMDYNGVKRQEAFITRQSNLLETMKIYKPHSAFKGDRAGESNVFQKAMKELENKDIPDPMVVVPKFLEHPDSRATESLLLESAEKAFIVADNELDSFGSYLFQRYVSIMGNRTDLLRNMTWQEFWLADAKGFTAYPFQKISENSNRSYTGQDNDPNAYVRKNLYGPDENDPNDMFTHNGDDPIWQAVRGIVLETDLHKTGPTYKGYIFLGVMDTILAKAYEMVLVNYFKAKFGSYWKWDSNKPIFLTSKYKPMLTTNSTPRFVEFCERAEISPSWTVYVCRHMYVKCMYDARSALLREAEQFALAHGQKTTVRNYLGDEHKKILSCVANSYYRQQIMKEAEITKVTSELGEVSTEQIERKLESLAQTDFEIIQSAIHLEKKKDSFFKPGRNNKVIGERHRVALIEMLYEGHKLGVSKLGSPLDLLTDRPVANKLSFRIILRTYYSLSPTRPCIKTLRESLLAFCSLQDHEQEDLDFHGIEVRWAERLISIILMLRKRSAGQRKISLINVFFQIAKETNSYKYCCGNKSIADQVLRWITVDRIKTAKRKASSKVVSLTEISNTYRSELDRLKTTTEIIGTSKVAKTELPQIPSQEEMDFHEHQTELQIEVDGKNVPLPDSVLSGGSKIIVKVETPTKKSMVISDELKLKLFVDVLNDCPDPVLSKRGKTGTQTALKQQYQYIREKEVDHNGEIVPWKFLIKDVMFVEIFYRKGFKSQWKESGIVPNRTGLLRIIQNVVGDPPEFDCKSVIDELLSEAKKYMI